MGDYIGEQGQKLLLYEHGNVLYFRSIRGEQSRRPLILCRDFSNGLSDICHNGMIYYCYCDIDGNIVVRSVRERQIYHFVPKRQGMEYCDPVLVMIGEKLCLFYVCKILDDDGCALNCVDCLTKVEKEIVHRRPGFLRYQCFNTNGSVVVGWCDGQEDAGYLELQESEEGDFFISKLLAERVMTQSLMEEGKKRQRAEERLQEQERTMRTLQETLQQERQDKRELEEELRQCDLTLKKLEKCREEQQEDCKKMEKRMKEQEKAIQKLRKENREHQGVLDSVKRQYEELMETASRYRDEAVKWRNRCRSRGI